MIRRKKRINLKLPEDHEAFNVYKKSYQEIDKKARENARKL